MTREKQGASAKPLAQLDGDYALQAVRDVAIGVALNVVLDLALDVAVAWWVESDLAFAERLRTAQEKAAGLRASG
jgi:hypothetical protein